MALLGLTIILGWLGYKFFAKWGWWWIGFILLFEVVSWFIKHGWIIFILICLVIAIGCLTLLIAHYRAIRKMR